MKLPQFFEGKTHHKFNGNSVKSVIIANMIYNFNAGKSPLIIGVRGFIFAGLP